MADMTMVEPGDILSAAGELDNHQAELSTLVGNFNSEIQRLIKSWKSPNTADFSSRFENDYTAMKEMLDQISDFAATLRQAAKDFEETEESVSADVAGLN